MLLLGLVVVVGIREMKLSDAKKILSGELVPYPGSQDFCVVPKGYGNKAVPPYNAKDWTYLTLTPKDVEFCLRQLALKVTREKAK